MYYIKLPNCASFSNSHHNLPLMNAVTEIFYLLMQAQACIESDGGAFEYKRKSFKK